MCYINILLTDGLGWGCLCYALNDVYKLIHLNIDLFTVTNTAFTNDCTWLNITHYQNKTLYNKLFFGTNFDRFVIIFANTQKASKV